MTAPTIAVAFPDSCRFLAVGCRLSEISKFQHQLHFAPCLTAPMFLGLLTTRQSCNKASWWSSVEGSRTISLTRLEEFFRAIGAPLQAVGSSLIAHCSINTVIIKHVPIWVRSQVTQWPISSFLNAVSVFPRQMMCLTPTSNVICTLFETSRSSFRSKSNFQLSGASYTAALNSPTT